MDIEQGHTELRVSPSSYDLWLRCQRWWAFQYIEGLRAPPGDKANLGSRCHTITERYLRDAEPPDHTERIELNTHGSARSYYPGRIVTNILHHLPAAGSVSRVEERLNFRYRGFKFVGVIDWQTDTHIGDHKFTGDLAYAKSEQDLIRDPQAVIYRTNRWLESDHRSLTLQWTYGQFDAKASKVIRLPVVREFASIDAFMPTIDAMHLAKIKVTEANTLEPTGLTLRPKIACELYGGCPHLNRCSRTGNQVHKNKLGAYMSSSVLERLRARAAAQDNSGANPNAHTSGSNGTAPRHAVQGAPPPAGVAGSVNPPNEAHDPVPRTEAHTPPPAASAGAPSPTVDQVVRRKRGRPPKNPPATTSAAPAVPEHTTTTGAPVPGVVSTTATAPESPDTGTQPALIGTLYVNCRPVRDTDMITDAYELIATAHRLVCEDQQVAHYKFIEYGKGVGALSVALGLVLADRGYTPAVYVHTHGAESLDSMQVLYERSARIVIGV